jgi:NAD(P)-dependent dehydrogenase (short-subunit alcohol dehydrogenase family)
MHVVLTARDARKGEGATQKLQDGESVVACARRLSQAGVEVDVLVNNAGVYPTDGVFSVSEETFGAALEINTIGPFRTCKAFVPGMVERGCDDAALKKRAHENWVRVLRATWRR